MNRTEHLLSILAEMVKDGLLGANVGSSVEIRAKMAKIEHYLEYSRKCGTLT